MMDVMHLVKKNEWICDGYTCVLDVPMLSNFSGARRIKLHAIQNNMFICSLLHLLMYVTLLQCILFALFQCMIACSCLRFIFALTLMQCSCLDFSSMFFYWVSHYMCMWIVPMLYVPNFEDVWSMIFMRLQCSLVFCLALVAPHTKMANMKLKGTLKRRKGGHTKQRQPV